MTDDAVSAAVRADRTGYVAYHAPRYRLLLVKAREYAGADARVLDIGRSPLTALLQEQFQRRVDTLGFGPAEQSGHLEFDLNDSQFAERWLTVAEPYDLIVFAEVLEHLYTSPARVLSFVRSLLTDRGVVLLQTPNAVVAHKRLQMLFGRNPFHLIADNRRNPAHFREYTMSELRRYALGAGFSVEAARAGAYFDYRYARHAVGDGRPQPWLGVVNFAYRLMPSSLRPGLTLVLRAN